MKFMALMRYTCKHAYIITILRKPRGWTSSIGIKDHGWLLVIIFSGTSGWGIKT